MTEAVAAVDLGATSGRVILGHVGGGILRLEQVARFGNGPVRTAGQLHWDALGLYREVLAGLREAIHRAPAIRSVGIDSWAVDYGLLRGGQLLGNPVHYRDERNPAAAERVHRRIGQAELYARNGLQHLPFTTVYQLEAEREAGRLELAEQLLLIPDLLGYWLTGQTVAERTNASTTGLLSLHDGDWDAALLTRLGYPAGLLAPLVDPATPIAGFLPEVAAEVGGSLELVAVGSHDTASAVAAVPALDDDFAYISCGTWALVGLELEKPLLSEAGRLAGFTNEGGVDGRIRYLHNVMGLWLLNECVRHWRDQGETVELDALLEQAASVEHAVPVFDADDARFLAPGDMPARIAEVLGEQGQPVPATRAELVRSIVESLAEAFARTLEQGRLLTGKRLRAVHLVGGGSQGELLCQLTADRTGLPVHAGPVEATAIGNVLVQARALGLIGGSLEALRALVAGTHPPKRYLPRSGAHRAAAVQA